jgi:hypothetical protein
MKVTKSQVVTVVGFIVSSLLLVLTANCSFEQKTPDDSTLKQAKEQSTEQEAHKEIFVANEFCSACHYAFGDEKLARTHERAGIGCERCHGESERHRSDEDNITPPEIMYPKEKINPTCMMCHPRNEIKHESRHDLLLAGAETIFDKSSNQKNCTDCHAKDHRINVRTIRWNKATGEILDN